MHFAKTDSVTVINHANIADSFTKEMGSRKRSMQYLHLSIVHRLGPFFQWEATLQNSEIPATWRRNSLSGLGRRMNVVAKFTCLTSQNIASFRHTSLLYCIYLCSLVHRCSLTAFSKKRAVVFDPSYRFLTSCGRY